MASHTVTVGNTEIVALVDATMDFPFEAFFPAVPAISAVTDLQLGDLVFVALDAREDRHRRVVVIHDVVRVSCRFVRKQF